MAIDVVAIDEHRIVRKPVTFASVRELGAYLTFVSVSLFASRLRCQRTFQEH